MSKKVDKHIQGTEHKNRQNNKYAKQEAVLSWALIVLSSIGIIASLTNTRIFHLILYVAFLVIGIASKIFD